MIRVKFCGLTRPNDAAFASTLKADYAGVILAESKRQVTPSQAAAIFAAAEGVRRVGVFRHRNIAEIIDEARSIELDVIQLHGRFRPDEVDQVREGFDGSLWAVVPFDEHRPRLPEWWSTVTDKVDAALVDTSVGGQSGGTGRTFDWDHAKPLIDILRGQTEIVLAGGLNPSNVAEAVRTLAPSVVDVSSGVESSPGIKDPVLMQAFAERARSASIV
jgi:phosphoribosylanthranilate isomerase